MMEIAVALPEGLRKKEDWMLRLGGLCAAFPDPMLIYAAVPSTDTDSISLDQHTVRPIPCPEEVFKANWGEMVWIQDLFAICCRHNIMVPSRSRVHERELIAKLARSSQMPLVEASFHFEGGNILHMGEDLLVGRNTLLLNGLDPQDHQYNFELEKRLEKDLLDGFGGRRLLWIGSQMPMSLGKEWFQSSESTFQPFFHLDMFLLPIGRIASGEMAVALAEIRPEYIVCRPGKDVAALETIQSSLLEIRSQLENAGYKVLDLPVAIGVSGSTPRIFSQLNGLSVPDSLGPRLVLPDYSELPSGPWRSAVVDIQARSQAFLRNIGIDVNYLRGGYEKFGPRFGALHCTTKIIRQPNSHEIWN